MKLIANEIVGNWRLVANLSRGRGGNGIVWKVSSRIDNKVGAIKFLQKRHVKEGDRYSRFLHEVQAMEACQDIRGVMKLLDCSLPERPDKNNPPWFVSELAVPLEAHLGEAYKLADVIEACESYARTLTEMHSRQYSHRDLKPDNLFHADGEWFIGDFGLVDFPGKERLTDTKEKVGALYYLAPEMLQSIGERDGRKADVWSLAKVLWKLATRQNYPIEGTIRADIPALRLSTYVNDSADDKLDSVLEAATQMEPERRIAMDQFHQELSSWVSEQKNTRQKPALGEVITLNERITALYAPIRRKEEEREAQTKEQALRLEKLEKIAKDFDRSCLTEIDNALKATGFSNKIHRASRQTNFDIILDALASSGFPTIRDMSCIAGVGGYAHAPTLDHATTISFLYSLGFNVDASGDSVTMVYGYYVSYFWGGRRGPTGSTHIYKPIWANKESFVLGGPKQKECLDRAGVDFAKEFKPSLKEILDIFEDYDQLRDSEI